MKLVAGLLHPASGSIQVTGKADWAGDEVTRFIHAGSSVNREVDEGS